MDRRTVPHLPHPAGSYPGAAYERNSVFAYFRFWPNLQPIEEIQEAPDRTVSPNREEMQVAQPKATLTLYERGKMLPSKLSIPSHLILYIIKNKPLNKNTEKYTPYYLENREELFKILLVPLD